MRRARKASSGLDLLVRPERAEASLWRRFRDTGQGRLRERLFDRYRRYASSLARRHARRSNVAPDVVEDLEQFAYQGLLEAIDRYEPLKRASFLTFATRRIAGSIVDGMGNIHELGAQLRFRRRMERERLASLMVKDADARRTATELLAELVAELALGLMLDAEEAAEPEGFSDHAENGFSTLAWRQTQVMLSQRLSELREPEQSVIRQHYQNDLPFAQVATILGLSRGRISQLHKSALGKLRKSMRSVR